MFQLIYRYFKKIGNTKHIWAWKLKGFSDESTNPPASFNNILAASLSYIGATPRVKLHGQCLKQDKVTFTHGNIVDTNIVYEIVSM